MTGQPNDDPLLSVRNLVVEYPTRDRAHRVHAVSDVSFEMRAGEVLGLVGESGCGKSTAARAVAGLGPITSGSVLFDGVDLAAAPASERRASRTNVQMIFQDPISSLNPRRTAHDIVRRPLDIWKIGTPAERDEKVRVVLEEVGIDPELATQRRPREFSGGQCQRISIARALVLEPKLLVCDEPVSALDVSVQAQVLNLLADLRSSHGLAVLFVAHDLAVVRSISDRVCVMYLGKVAEVGHTDGVFEQTRHHYTQALLHAVPTPDPDVVPLKEHRLVGELPSPMDPPSGCRFRTRCRRAEDACATEPPLESSGTDPEHLVACHFPLGVGDPTGVLGAGGEAPG